MKRFLLILSLLLPATGFAGVTIHYSGELVKSAEAGRIVRIAANFAKERNWRYKMEKGGIVLFPNKWCEPLHLSFRGRVLKRDFVKTQFAGVDVHIEIVKLLRAIKPLFSRLVVDDEGEYWETGDRSKLELNINAVNLMMEHIKKTHPGAVGPTRLPNGRIIDIHT